MCSFGKDDIAPEKLLPAFPIRILTHQVLMECKNSDIEVVLWDVHWRETSQPRSHQLELEMWIVRFWPRLVSSNGSVCSADFSRTVWTWDTPAVLKLGNIYQGQPMGTQECLSGSSKTSPVVSLWKLSKRFLSRRQVVYWPCHENRRILRKVMVWEGEPVNTWRCWKQSNKTPKQIAKKVLAKWAPKNMSARKTYVDWKNLCCVADFQSPSMPWTSRFGGEAGGSAT